MTLDSRFFPGFNRIHHLLEPGGSQAFRVEARVSSVDEAFARTRAETNLAPLGVKWAMGEASPRDVICSTIVATRLISNRVVDLFTSEGFTGWVTYPVELLGKHGELIEGYHGLAVDGRCGTIDDTRSVRFEKQYPGGIFPCWRGYYFDEKSWDGSHIFVPDDGSVRIFMLDEVRRALKRAKVRNVDFTALDQVERIPIPGTGDPPKLT